VSEVKITGGKNLSSWLKLIEFDISNKLGSLDGSVHTMMQALKLVSVPVVDVEMYKKLWLHFSNVEKEREIESVRKDFELLEKSSNMVKNSFFFTTLATIEYYFGNVEKALDALQVGLSKEAVPSDVLNYTIEKIKYSIRKENEKNLKNVQNVGRDMGKENIPIDQNLFKKENIISEKRNCFY